MSNRFHFSPLLPALCLSDGAPDNFCLFTRQKSRIDVVRPPAIDTTRERARVFVSVGVHRTSLPINKTERTDSHGAREVRPALINQVCYSSPTEMRRAREGIPPVSEAQNSLLQTRLATRHRAFVLEERSPPDIRAGGGMVTGGACRGRGGGD